MKVFLLQTGILCALLFGFSGVFAQVNPDCQCIHIGKRVGDKVRVSGVIYTITHVSEDINGCVYDDCSRGACFWHWKAVAENGSTIHKNVIEGCEKAPKDKEPVSTYGKAQSFELSGFGPNPVERGQTVNFSIQTDGGHLEMHVQALNGQGQKHSYYFEDGRNFQKVSLDSALLAPGIYLVRLGSGQSFQTHRLVVH